MWRKRQTVCTVCKQAIEPSEFTCGEDACELAALESQAMLAPLVADQEARIARKVCFEAPLPAPNLKLC